MLPKRWNPAKGLVWLFALIAIAMPHALARAEDDKGLKAVLGTVVWGERKDEVLAKLRDESFGKLRDDPALRRDSVLMQEARRTAVERFKEVEKSWKELNGQRSGYEVSVVSDEFSPNNGEALLKVRDDVAQRFFFFIDGRLYKVVVAYTPDYVANVGFEAFVAHTARRYGKPVEEDWVEEQDQRLLASATWKDPESMLRVTNRREYFSTYTMTFVDAKAYERLSARLKAFGAKAPQGEELSSSVRGVMESTAHDGHSNVLDGIVGSVQIDLARGRPKDDAPAAGQETAAKGAPAEDKAKVDEKSAKAKPKGRTRKQQPKADFVDTTTKGSTNDLIIY